MPAKVKCYKWSYRITVPPYDKIVAVLEAFYCSYPKGDYLCEGRERYKLIFRRGRWRRSLLALGQFVPDKLPPGRFNQWPIIVRLLVRPAPEVFTITVYYQLYLPKGTPELKPEVQSSVDQHVRLELADLAGYLGECIGLTQPPAVSVSE